MDVAEDGGLAPGYTLKLNSYDLGVDIELADAVQRLRFEHPEVAAVVITSAKPRVFCAGANIQMLGLSTHADKVNFCKFTNETRLAIEDASENSRQAYICAINGACAGGGYELALAADTIMLCDDGSSTVSLPELPLLAVLPGTGGLTRLVDKRKVRHDHADYFCTLTEGIRGERAKDWRLVDELVPRSRFDEAVKRARTREVAAKSDRPAEAKGIALGPLEHKYVAVEKDRALGVARITVKSPETLPADLAGIHAAGAAFWPLALARELDDAVLDLRVNEPELGTWVFRSRRRRRARPRSRRAAHGSRGRLAGARDHAISEARPEARRSVGAQPLRAGRAGKLLRRHAGRAGAGRRPFLHAGRKLRGF